jgi:hypothetical protein
MFTPTNNIIPKHDPKVLEKPLTIKETYNSFHQAKELISQFWAVFKPEPKKTKIDSNPETN